MRRWQIAEMTTASLGSPATLWLRRAGPFHKQPNSVGYTEYLQHVQRHLWRLGRCFTISGLIDNDTHQLNSTVVHGEVHAIVLTISTTIFA